VTRAVFPRGLYVVTDATLSPGPALQAAVVEALVGGATAVQYRDKGVGAARRLDEATALRDLCAAHRAVLIVNDDVDLAARAGAHGVHVGEDDAGVAEARAALGAGALVGVSCYDSLARAEQAQADGADYVAFGSFYPSATKPHARRASPALLAQASARLSVPIVAIGGITPENGAPLVAAGAHALAVVSGVFAATDPRAAARRYASLFDTPHGSSR
jgi:thiamine-phosphate pyrophosphorylase